MGTEGDTVRVPPVLFQPIASEDVAKAVARVSVGSPVNGIVEVAGPYEYRMDELVRRALQALNDPRHVVADPDALYFGDYKVDDSTLVPAERRARRRDPLRGLARASARGRVTSCRPCE